MNDISTPLDILNKILDDQGCKQVMSCYDNFYFKEFYHPTRRILLCQLKPDFAKKTFLAKNGETHLPDDLMRIISLKPNEYKLDRINRVIILDKEQEIEYISDEEDVTKFNVEFLKQLIEELKKKIFWY